MPLVHGKLAEYDEPKKQIKQMRSYCTMKRVKKMPEKNLYLWCDLLNLYDMIIKWKVERSGQRISTWISMAFSISFGSVDSYIPFQQETQFIE